MDLGEGMHESVDENSKGIPVIDPKFEGIFPDIEKCSVRGEVSPARSSQVLECNFAQKEVRNGTT